MRKAAATGVAMVMAALVVSCSSARVVSVRPGQGGIIALTSPSSARARAQASQIMAENCPGGRYEVVKEGESVVGARATSPQKAARVSSNVGVSVGGSSLRHETEWRLHYRCRMMAR